MGLLAVAVIALVVTLTLQIAVFGRPEYKEMCQTEECIRTGKCADDYMSFDGFFWGSGVRLARNAVREKVERRLLSVVLNFSGRWCNVGMIIFT